MTDGADELRRFFSRLDPAHDDWPTHFCNTLLAVKKTPE